MLPSTIIAFFVIVLVAVPDCLEWPLPEAIPKQFLDFSVGFSASMLILPVVASLLVVLPRGYGFG